MVIETTAQFDKHYQKRILPNKNLTLKFAERIKMFVNDPQDPILKNHKLSGTKRTLRSFSITGDIRVIYLQNSPSKVIFLDVGSHNQVY